MKITGWECYDDTFSVYYIDDNDGREYEYTVYLTDKAITKYINGYSLDRIFRDDWNIVQYVADELDDYLYKYINKNGSAERLAREAEESAYYARLDEYTKRGLSLKDFF